MKYSVSCKESTYGDGHYVSVRVDETQVHHEYYETRTWARFVAWWWNFRLSNGLYSVKNYQDIHYEGDVK